ncbi:hypothetical protein HOL34_01545 [bacterium]|jgi:hypothetical protein|nr:hypothetical protein [bacterium]MBT3903278.1 hypothetical protein [bacterium]MBT4577867.1 hypothetical protein [bacterium]MBT5345954.1 hypothetical protein [bacterium]MBT6130740.1 hypothetical protein [bacterium]
MKTNKKPAIFYPACSCTNKKQKTDSPVVCTKFSKELGETILKLLQDAQAKSASKKQKIQSKVDRFVLARRTTWNVSARA